MKKKANNILKEQALEMQIKLLQETINNKDNIIKNLEKENADLKVQLARK